jgi:hypothetical protein
VDLSNSKMRRQTGLLLEEGLREVAMIIFDFRKMPPSSVLPQGQCH